MNGNKLVISLQRRRMKNLWIIFAILIGFAICYLPNLLYFLVQHYSARVRGRWGCDELNYNFWAFGAIIDTFSIAFTPIVYWLLNDEFQMGCKKMASDMLRFARGVIYFYFNFFIKKDSSLALNNGQT